jgi:serine/threonine protein kinase
MDYIEGADWVGRLSPEPAVRLAREAAYAVQVLHDAGVVHRDLKPSNLLVDSLRAAVGTATVRRAGRCLLGRPQRRDAPAPLDDEIGVAVALLALGTAVGWLLR